MKSSGALANTKNKSTDQIKNVSSKRSKILCNYLSFLRSRAMQETLQLLSFTFFINLEICEYYQVISDNIFV